MGLLGASKRIVVVRVFVESGLGGRDLVAFVELETVSVFEVIRSQNKCLFGAVCPYLERWFETIVNTR